MRLKLKDDSLFKRMRKAKCKARLAARRSASGRFSRTCLDIDAPPRARRE